MSARTWLRAEWDRVAGFGLIALGGLLLLLGYLGVRGTPFTTEALAYIASGGLGGIFCLGLGVGLLLSADLHDEWLKLDRIEAALRGAPLPDPNDVLEGTRNPTLALAPDRRASGFRQAAIGGSLALLLPLSVLGLSWRKIARTEHLATAADGMGAAMLGLSVGLTVIALSVVWMRLRVGRRARGVLAQSGKTDVDIGLDPEVLVMAGLRRFHRSTCPVLNGIAATPVARSELDPDMVPCGICGVR